MRVAVVVILHADKINNERVSSGQNASLCFIALFKRLCV